MAKVKFTRKQKKVDNPILPEGIDIDNLSREEILELLNALNSDEFGFNEVEECRLYLYKPNHEVALEFHICDSPIIMAGGGNRSGKTTSSIARMMIRLTGIVPRSLEGILPPKELKQPQKLRIVSTDFPNGIDKVILPMFIGASAWFPQSMIVHWDSKSRTLQVRNTQGSVSIIEFMSYDQDVEKFQGTSRDAILYDEEPPKAIRDECKMRVMDVDGIEIFSETPTKGMSWTFDEIFEKRGREVVFDKDTELEKGGVDDRVALVGEPDVDIICPDGDPDISFFGFFSQNNPNINQARVKKEASKMTEEERAMRMFGEYVSFTGKVFKEYSDKVHLVKEPFEIPQDWPRYMALDPHPRTPHAVLFLAVDSMGRKWVYDEIWTKEACGLPDLAREILKHEYDQCPENAENDIPFDVEMYCNPSGIWMLKKPITFKRPWVVRRFIDPAANIPNPQTSTTLMDDLTRLGVGPFLLGSKDLQRGILRVKEALRHEDREPEVFFFPHLARTRFEFQRYVWEDWKGNSDNKSPKQVPKDKDDHMMENLRRLIVSEPLFVKRELFNQPLKDWRQY